LTRPEAVPMAKYVERIRDPDRAIRTEALDVLSSRCGPEHSELAPDLARAVVHRVRGVETVAVALGRIGPGAEMAVPALLGLLQDPEPSRRGAAAAALASIGKPAAARAIPLLTSVLEHNRDLSVRRQAAWALAKLAEDSEAAMAPLVPKLMGIEDDIQEDPGIRTHARAGVAQILGSPDEAVFEIVRRSRGMEESLAEMIDTCSAKVPHPAWEQMRGVDLDADAGAIADWFGLALSEDPPPRTISTLQFGTHIHVWESGERAAVLYVLGGQVGGETRGRLHEYSWAPETHSEVSPAQAAFYAVARSAGHEVEWWTTRGVCFVHAACSTNALLDRMSPAALLGKRPSLSIIAAPHSGRALFLGVLTEYGMDRSDYGWV
jgi:hypothetical protein